MSAEYVYNKTVSTLTENGKYEKTWDVERQAGHATAQAGYKDASAIPGLGATELSWAQTGMNEVE